MAKHPKDASEAVTALGIESGSTVIAVGPDHGFVEALSEAVGKDGKLIVQAPPPDLETPDSVEVVDEVADDTKASTVIAWVGVVQLHEARSVGEHVQPQGAFWLVLPKVPRDERAPVTEGDLKRAMLSGGWSQDRTQALSNDAFAVRYRRRR